jgi:hypothetical protein
MEKVNYLDSRDIRYIDNEHKLNEKLKKIEESTLLSQTGECMTFGKHTQLVKSFFDNMNFDYLQKITRIGEKSINGFINEMTFNKDGYELNTILKSSLTNSSDNLVYEYYVGTYFINLLMSFFPCFIETFNIYSYKNLEFIYKDLSSQKHVHDYVIDNIKKNLKNVDKKDSKNDCTFDKKILLESYYNPMNICILIEHIKNPITLYDFFKIPQSTPIWGLHLFFILLQIYLPLGKLMNNFTHNDLHAANILLYKLKNNEYIEMEYELEDGSIIKFNTQYIVKIIDYGRSYFNSIDNKCSSEIFFKSIFQEVSENPLKINDRIVQLQSRGYGYFIGLDSDDEYISTYHGNISIDLHALKGIYRLKSIIINLINELYMRNLLDLVKQTIETFPEVNVKVNKNGKIVTEKKRLFNPSKSKEANVESFSNNLIKVFQSNYRDIEHLIQQNFIGKKRGNMKIYMSMKKPMDIYFDVNISKPIRKTQEEIEKIELALYYNKHYVSPDLNSDNNYDDIFKSVSSQVSKTSKSNKSSNKISNKGSKSSNKISNKGSKSSNKISNKISNKGSNKISNKGSKNSNKNSKSNKIL